MQVGLKNWQAFKDQFLKFYRRYQIWKKPTAAAHGYGASEKHVYETDAQGMTADALQELSNATMEAKESMENLTSINLTLSKSFTQAQETILVLSKKLQALQAHTNPKKLATEKLANDKKQYINK